MEVDEAYKELKERGLIAPGKFIPQALIEELLEITFKHGDWEFVGKFLQLKEYIESKGFFCTSRKCGVGALRLLHHKEYAHKLENLQKTVMRKQKRAINTLRNTDAEDLSDNELKNLMHVQNKLILGAHAMNSVIYNI